MIREKVRFRVTPENAKPQSWVMKTVRQQNTDDHSCSVAHICFIGKTRTSLDNFVRGC